MGHVLQSRVGALQSQSLSPRFNPLVILNACFGKHLARECTLQALWSIWGTLKGSLRGFRVGDPEPARKNIVSEPTANFWTCIEAHSLPVFLPQSSI